MSETNFQPLRDALAALPKIEPWFVVGAPWGKGDLVVSGHFDPHVGQYVADAEDVDGDAESPSLENAAYIAAANPAVVQQLLVELDAARATAQKTPPPQTFAGLPLAESALSHDECMRWLAVINPMLKYAGSPGDWGYESWLGRLTQHLYQLRAELERALRRDL